MNDPLDAPQAVRQGGVVGLDVSAESVSQSRRRAMVTMARHLVADELFGRGWEKGGLYRARPRTGV